MFKNEQEKEQITNLQARTSEIEDEIAVLKNLVHTADLEKLAETVKSLKQEVTSLKEGYSKQETALKELNSKVEQLLAINKATAKNIPDFINTFKDALPGIVDLTTGNINFEKLSETAQEIVNKTMDAKQEAENSKPEEKKKVN